MKYDLLLTGGDVLDPAAGLRGVMDVGIAGGKITAVAASLPAHEARRTISAKGRLVTPGLVDMHAHVFVNTHDMGGRTDCICQASGVTTLCDAGSSGLRDVRRDAPPAGQGGAHPRARTGQSVGHRHHGNVAWWRTGASAVRRSRRLRAHDHRKS